MRVKTAFFIAVFAHTYSYTLLPAFCRIKFFAALFFCCFFFLLYAHAVADVQERERGEGCFLPPRQTFCTHFYSHAFNCKCGKMKIERKWTSLVLLLPLSNDDDEFVLGARLFFSVISHRRVYFVYFLFFLLLLCSHCHYIVVTVYCCSLLQTIFFFVCVFDAFSAIVFFSCMRKFEAMFT